MHSDPQHLHVRARRSALPGSVHLDLPLSPPSTHDCGFSYLIGPFTNLIPCTHWGAHMCTRTSAHRFLCWFQYRLGEGDFALISIIVRNVSAFLLSQQSRYFCLGRGSTGRDTDPVTKWCWWEGRHKKHSYLLSCGSHSRVGHGVFRVSPHPT